MVGPEGREFTEIALGLGLPFHGCPSGFLKLPLIFHTARLIRRHRVQIVHARHGRDYWPAILAAKLAGTRPKVVLSRHLAKSPGSWLSRRFLLSQCDALVAVSQFVAKVLREGHADPGSDNPDRKYRGPMRGDFSKVKVIYGGFDMERFQPGTAEAQRRAWGWNSEHYVFCVAGRYNLPHGKGQRVFLQAAARVREKLPRARFVLVGRGTLKPLLEEDIKRLHLEDVVLLAPYSQDMPAVMNAMDCLVVPQIATEAIPGVVCEAHACGKPVIASDLDGIPEAFAPASYGKLVTRGAVDELASAMIDWGGRPPLDLTARRELHRKVAAVFSLERAARDLSALYAELLRA